MPGKPFHRLSTFLAEAISRGQGVPSALSNTRSLQRIWREVVPPPLGAHTRPVMLRDGLLVVTADSSAWAAKLRHQQQSLASRLRSRPDLAGLRRLVVKVAPPDTIPPASSSARAFHISTEAKQVLADAAEHIEDPELQAALRRLARRRNG